MWELTKAWETSDEERGLDSGGKRLKRPIDVLCAFTSGRAIGGARWDN